MPIFEKSYNCKRNKKLNEIYALENQNYTLIKTINKVYAGFTKPDRTMAAERKTKSH